MIFKNALDVNHFSKDMDMERRDNENVNSLPKPQWQLSVQNLHGKGSGRKAQVQILLGKKSGMRYFCPKIVAEEPKA